MARGWESKAVADQIEEGKSESRFKTSRPLSNEERVRRQKLDSLQLSRSRLLEQLEHAKHTAHRQVLQRGLQAMEMEIDELSKD